MPCCRSDAAGASVPVLPQCSQAALNAGCRAAWGRGFAGDWHSLALLLPAQPCNVLHIVLQGKGPRGEEGVLSAQKVPKDRVSVELHDAKMSVCAVYLLVFNFAKRATVALNSPRKRWPVSAETNAPDMVSAGCAFVLGKLVFWEKSQGI